MALVGMMRFFKINTKTNNLGVDERSVAWTPDTKVQSLR